MKTTSSLLCILIGCLHASFSFATEGPVPVASLPGGGFVIDSDTGSGEAWGRAGGRTYDYTVLDLPSYTLLEWQSLSAAMSFDGPVDAAGETMIGASQGPADLVYTGSTNVQLTNLGLRAVQTRFKVHLTGAMFVPGTTKVDVTATTGNFSVNVLFEAMVQDVAGWGPALDVFDALQTTPPPATMLANTSFQQGFFFDDDGGGDPGLSLAEHDANMQTRADAIAGKLDHLTLEEVGHFLQLTGEHDDLETQLEALLGAGGSEQELLAIQAAIAQNNLQLMDVLFAINNLPGSDELREIQDGLTGLIACLWLGIFCPDEVPDGAPNLGLISADLAEILDGIDWAKEDIGTIMEDLDKIIDGVAANAVPTAIELEVISSSRGSEDSRIFLVLSKVHGIPTTTTLSVTAAPESGRSGFSLVPVSATSIELAPGVQQLTVDVQGRLSSTQTFLINAERMLPDDTMQYGSTLTSSGDQDDD